MSIITTLELHNHPIFKSTKIHLAPETEARNNGNFITLIIGQNGTGKSQLLRCIAEIINFEHSAYQPQQKKKILGYSYDINPNESPTPKTPKTIIASAFSLNDKFPNIDKRNRLHNPNYKYLGIRSTSNNAFIGKYKKDFLTHLNKILNNEKKTKSLLAALKEIDLPTNFRFTFKKARGMANILNNAISSKSFSEFSKSSKALLNRQLTENTYRLDNTNKQKLFDEEDLQNRIYNFIRKIEEEKLNNLEYEVDLKSSDNSIFLAHSSDLEMLVELGVLDVAEFSISAKSTHSLNAASSGQYHIITSLIGLTANIDEQSIVLIDEPEISLHPNWQIKYINSLLSIISEIKECQVVISTHSHFLPANLPPERSRLISSKSDENGEIHFTEITSSAYGWSPENILYNIFGVTSTRNSYFELDLRNLISIVSHNTGNIAELKDILKRIKRFNITKNDPLSLAIKQAEDYMAEKS